VRKIQATTEDATVLFERSLNCDVWLVLAWHCRLFLFTVECYRLL